MDLNTTGKHLASDPSSENLIHFLDKNETDLSLTDSMVYYDFPLFRDPYGGVIASKILILSAISTPCLDIATSAP